MNAFNSVLKRVIFQEFPIVGGDIIQLIPFVNAFYAFESPSFYSHHNHDGDVTIIPSTMETRQGDPLGGALFVLIHLRALPSTTSHFSSCFHPLQLTFISLAPLPVYPWHMNIFRFNSMR